MKTLCIIPARGGSKRIPRKNIKPFLGKPIMAYSIEAALQSGIFADVMVSTDDAEIAAVARQYGASVPFMRSADTANDYAGTDDVLREVIQRYHQSGQDFDAVCCVYSTAPFVTPERLRQGYEVLSADPQVTSAFPVVAYSYPVQRCVRISSQGYAGMARPEYISARSQDLEPIYHDAGQFYYMKMMKDNQLSSIWGGLTKPLVLSELEVQDLDTPTDWQLAEMKYRLLHPE